MPVNFLAPAPPHQATAVLKSDHVRAFIRKSIVCVIVLGAFAALALAADKGDPVWTKWWQKFQTSVARREIRAIDKGVEFPMDWQISSDVRAVRSESDFAANFGIFFTPDVIKNVAIAKPEKLPNGNYNITWKTEGKDYTMTFHFYGGTYALDSLVEGHP